jgi:hypothetical protein
MSDGQTSLVDEGGQLDIGRYLQVLRAEPPKVLYHFTSTEGLAGIVRERKLRLTRAVCSNDASEVRHVLDFARSGVEVIREIDQSSQGLSGAARAALERLWQRLRDDNAGWHGEMNLRHTLVFDAGLPDPYLACFCADARPGLLHWGHYGRAGEGFAIEVDSSRLLDEWRTRFVKVRYDDSQRAWDIMKLLEGFLLAEKGEAKPKPDDVLSRYRATVVADQMEAALRAISVGMKDSEFEAENEWRVTWLRDVDGELPLHIRSAGAELISYVEMPLPIEAIRRIVVGTKRDVRRTAGSLAAYLYAQGVYHIEVDESRIPFR